MKNLFLIGFMGCGKSTIADTLEKKWNFDRIEMDQELVRQAGMSIPQIFEKYGEAHFRQMETDFLRSLAAGENQVISCGGGVVMRQENVELMRQGGTTVLLTATPETIYARIGHDQNRPMLKGRHSVAGIAELMEIRRPHYEAAADVVISTDGKTAEQICEEIMATQQV